MQAPPLFTSMQRMRRIQNKYCENAKSTVDKRTTARGYSESQGQAALDNKGARMFDLTVSDIFCVLEHVWFSSLWLKITRIIVYANVGTRTTGIWLLC